MADAAVEFLLGNLKQLLVYNADLISNVKDHVESLCNDLGLLNAFVKESSESRSNHAMVEELVRQIRIEVYKAEDIIDTYVSNAYIQKTRSSFAKAIHMPDYSLKLRSVGKQIQDIRKRVKEIYDSKLFGNDLISIKSTAESFTSRSFPCVEEENVVGFDEHAKKVGGWLKAETEELEVISVVGMGGLGKTTLVKKVYNDVSTRYKFPIRCWVYVSQVYSPREVFLNILYGVTQESRDTSKGTVETIADELRRKLEDVKYLIVLDDIWSEKAWDDLKIVFPNTKNGSRILITSRITEVAMHAKTTHLPYQLDFLTEDQSWELLEKKVFPKGTRCSRELEDIGKQIAKKCCGLPLTIVVIAGILKKRDKTPSLWEKIKQNVSTYVARKPEQCMEVLALSYRHLPYHLKACFLHFGVFPEDLEIPVWKLIHIWVAEGFIQKVGNASLEEMAEENLLDLVDRNLVMVERRRANGGIKTCRIHDMLREVCVKQAGDENFFKEIKDSEPSIYKAVDPNIFRRVSVHSGVLGYVSKNLDSSHVRSFLCYGPDVLLPDLIKDFPRSFKLLRVLDVLPISFTRFPSIQLVHLRYVALLGTFEVLPAAISNLWNLQTLIVETNVRKIEVKADLWKLSHLRHVYTSAASVLPTPSSNSQEGAKDNQNLRTLSKVSPDSCTDVILDRTPNLQKLSVRGNLLLLLEEANNICKFDNIATRLGHLEKLKLLHDTFPRSPVVFKLRALPKFYKFPPTLKKLTLSETRLDWEQMSVLANLQGLEVLKLKEYVFMGERWVTPDGGFVRLRVLQIGKTDLVHWEAAGHQFPQLQRLSLDHCKQLIAIPPGLGEISTLQVVELSWTSQSAVASARSIQKNFTLRVSPEDTQT